MKKLKLKALAPGAGEALTRAQMRNVLGSLGGGGTSGCGSGCSGSCTANSGVCKGKSGTCGTSGGGCVCAAVC